MKWVTVKEYAESRHLSLAAAYKQVKLNRVRHEKKFGKVVIAIEDKKEAA
jgi:hypothetical protein